MDGTPGMAGAGNTAKHIRKGLMSSIMLISLVGGAAVASTDTSTQLTSARPVSSAPFLTAEPSNAQAYTSGMVVKVWPASGIDSTHSLPRHSEGFSAAAIDNSTGVLNLETVSRHPELGQTIKSEDMYCVEWSGYIYVPADGEYTLRVKALATRASYRMNLSLDGESLLSAPWRRYREENVRTGTTRLTAGYHAVSFMMIADDECDAGKIELAMREPGNMEFTPLSPANMCHDSSLNEAEPISTEAPADTHDHAPGMVVKVWPRSGINLSDNCPSNPSAFSASVVDNTSSPIKLENIARHPELSQTIKSEDSYCAEWSGVIYVPESGEYTVRVSSLATKASYRMNLSLDGEELLSCPWRRYRRENVRVGTRHLEAGFHPISFMMIADDECDAGKIEIGLRRAGSLEFTPLTPASMYYAPVSAAPSVTATPAVAGEYTSGMVVKVWPRSGIDMGNNCPRDIDGFSAAAVDSGSGTIRLENISRHPELGQTTRSEGTYCVEWSGYIYVPEDGEYAIRVNTLATRASYRMSLALDGETLLSCPWRRYRLANVRSGATYLTAGYHPVSLLLIADKQCDSGKIEIGIRQANSLEFTPLTPANFFHQ